MHLSNHDRGPEAIHSQHSAAARLLAAAASSPASAQLYPHSHPLPPATVMLADTCDLLPAAASLSLPPAAEWSRSASAVASAAAERAAAVAAANDLASAPSFLLPAAHSRLSSRGRWEAAAATAAEISAAEYASHAHPAATLEDHYQRQFYSCDPPVSSVERDDGFPAHRWEEMLSPGSLSVPAHLAGLTPLAHPTPPPAHDTSAPHYSLQASVERSLEAARKTHGWMVGRAKDDAAAAGGGLDRPAHAHGAHHHPALFLGTDRDSVAASGSGSDCSPSLSLSSTSSSSLCSLRSTGGLASSTSLPSLLPWATEWESPVSTDSSTSSMSSARSMHAPLRQLDVDTPSPDLSSLASYAPRTGSSTGSEDSCSSASSYASSNTRTTSSSVSSASSRSFASSSRSSKFGFNSGWGLPRVTSEEERGTSQGESCFDSSDADRRAHAASRSATPLEDSTPLQYHSSDDDNRWRAANRAAEFTLPPSALPSLPQHLSPDSDESDLSPPLPRFPCNFNELFDARSAALQLSAVPAPAPTPSAEDAKAKELQWGTFLLPSAPVFDDRREVPFEFD